MNNVEKAVKQFTEAMQKQERINYNCALNGLRNGNITFRVDEEENETLVRFNPCDEELVLEFEDYGFLREINPALLWYCHTKQPIPMFQLEILTLEEQAQMITKLIEECDCMCSYEYYSNLLAACS